MSATAGAVSIVSYATVVGAPVGIGSAGFTMVFSLPTGIIKKLLNKRNKKKKHDIIPMLAKSKLNSTETLVSQGLKEKDKYEEMKENIRNVSEKLEEKQEI